MLWYLLLQSSSLHHNFHFYLSIRCRDISIVWWNGLEELLSFSYWFIVGRKVYSCLDPVTYRVEFIFPAGSNFVHEINSTVWSVWFLQGLTEGQEGRARNSRLVSLLSVPGKVMEHLNLEIIAKHKKDERLIETGWRKPAYTAAWDKTSKIWSETFSSLTVLCEIPLSWKRFQIHSFWANASTISFCCRIAEPRNFTTFKLVWCLLRVPSPRHNRKVNTPSASKALWPHCCAMTLLMHEEAALRLCFFVANNPPDL